MVATFICIETPERTVEAINWSSYSYPDAYFVNLTREKKYILLKTGEEGVLLHPRWGHLCAVGVTAGRVSAKGQEYRCAGHAAELPLSKDTPL